ncbi:polyprenyl diphosphate synthase [Salinisphaera aquimarina]|uniref:Ditrans,polycis-undecaprenyl-diphosphate synthase ((2E,6E)-farnesyl-diphosphate specific) n=1 Tax=Salinisphaera aquimarina TaxID=2094031 RepID=A0ABV7EUC9_9GAMM
MSAPRHVAVIMDGNGRWANARGLPRAAGHRAGAKSARSIVENAQRNGVKVLTLFAFSSENWQRPRAEVRVLLDLFRRTIGREIDALHDNGVRLSFIGDRSRFSKALQSDMRDAEARTQNNATLDLVIAVDYGGRWDMVQAARACAQACLDDDLTPETITAEAMAQHLSLHRFGEPDLFIRTGGERRISNFLLWDLAYSELYFTDRLWPDFDAESLRDALDWFAQRERRFGRLPSATRTSRA